MSTFPSAKKSREKSVPIFNFASRRPLFIDILFSSSLISTVGFSLATSNLRAASPPLWCAIFTLITSARGESISKLIAAVFRVSPLCVTTFGVTKHEIWFSVIRAACTCLPYCTLKPSRINQKPSVNFIYISYDLQLHRGDELMHRLLLPVKALHLVLEN